VRQIEAMRSRFATADRQAGSTSLEIAVLDERAAALVRDRLLVARRRLEKIGDRLRTLNTTTTIECDDAALAYLRAEQVT
jgi:hypothetical protein